MQTLSILFLCWNQLPLTWNLKICKASCQALMFSCQIFIKSYMANIIIPIGGGCGNWGFEKSRNLSQVFQPRTRKLLIRWVQWGRHPIYNPILGTVLDRGLTNVVSFHSPPVLSLFSFKHRFTLTWDFSTWAVMTLLAEWLFVVGPVLCNAGLRMFSSIPGL